MNLRFMLVGAIFAGVATGAPLPATGPDAFGYTGVAIAGNLRNIESTGTIVSDVSNADDAVSSDIEIGFTFNFYGTDFTQFRISTNGFIGFGGLSDDHCCDPEPLPDASFTPPNVIHGWKRNLNLHPIWGNGDVYTQTIGSPGSRQTIVGFYDVYSYLDTDPNTFEIILHEGSNNIEVQWGARRTLSGIHRLPSASRTARRPSASNHCSGLRM